MAGQAASEPHTAHAAGINADWATRYDAAMFAAIAAAVRPRRRVRPSEWAEAHVSLTAEMSPERPGPWSNRFMPWIRCGLDLQHDNPGKCGAVILKGAQMSFSTLMLVHRACRCVVDPGPFLYLISDDRQSKHFVSEKWDPIVASVPSLAELFARGAEDRREVLLERPFPGGRMDYAGAGSPGSVSARTYREMDVDEFDQVEENFPAKFGGVWSFLSGRTAALRGRTWVNAWSHPTFWNRGIARLWDEQSDRGRWVFDCPHAGCGFPIAPRWTGDHRGASCIRYEKTVGDDARPDPESVVFFCPACSRPISDAQRQRAVWPSDLVSGGSGRRESALPASEAATRPLAGLWVHGLCNPYKTVAAYAREFSVAPDEKERRAYLNVRFGEPAEEGAGGQVLDAAAVREMMAESPAPVLPGGRTGVQFVCAGADVQAPRDNPTIYAAAVAFGSNGHDWLVSLQKVSGFAAWMDWLAGVSVQRQSDTPLGVRCAAIDDGYETGLVKDTCRFGRVYAAATASVVSLVPVRYVASSTLNADNPFVMRTMHKRVHPSRPELGAIDMYDLHRHSWVDRVLLKIGGRRLHLAAGVKVPPDLEPHLSSQLLTPKKTQHGNWEDQRMEWDRAKDRRDDWLMAIVYAYAIAAIRCGLDRIHLNMQEPAGSGAAGAKINVPKWGGM